MRQKKFHFALSGLNFLYGAYHSFLEERNIFLKNIKSYPTRESSFKAKKLVSKLNNVIKQLEELIKKLKIGLVI